MITNLSSAKPKRLDPDVTDMPNIHDGVYDAYYGKHGDVFMQDTQRRIHWICSQVNGNQVFDVGCSQGITSILLGREGTKVTGVDVDSKAIEDAKMNLMHEPRHVQNNINFLLADATDVQLKQKMFDTVILTEVLEHLIKPEKLIGSVLEHLAPGGRLIVTVPFGINDFIDHKHTFYLREPYRLISKNLDILDVVVLGKWIGFVAISREKSLGSVNIDSFNNELVKRLESGFFDIEREMTNRIGLLKNQLNEERNHHLQTTNHLSNERRLFTEEKESHKLARTSNQSIKMRLESLERLSQEEKLSTNIAYKSLGSAERKIANLEVEIDSSNVKINEEKSNNTALSEKIEFLTDSLSKSKSSVEEKKTKISRLEQKIQERLEYLKTLESKAEKLNAGYKVEKEKVLKLQKSLDRTNRIVEREATLIQTEKNKSIRAKNTLSFQLGHALIFGFKSFHEFKLLPNKLISLRKEAIRRRGPYNIKNDKKEVGLPQPVISKPASTHLAIKQKSGELPPTPAILKQESSPRTVQKLRALSILDEISDLNWSGEFDLQHLRRPDFAEHIGSAEVDFALLESCWKGNGGDWEYAFTSPGLKHANAQALLEAMDKLKVSGKKIIFWNKEDPMHFEKYLPIASRADVIFTTDSNMVEEYRQRTSLPTSALAFGANPSICNPQDRFRIEPEGVCFAGAFYSKGHNERKRQMEFILPAIDHFKGTIYDRYSELNNERYAFPARYQPYIRDGVPFSEVTKLYKSFKVFLNVNTIIDSPSMMSRRVYEILATGTPIVSAPSKALETQFPDLVDIAATEKEVVAKVSKLLEDQDHWERRSHLGYREVLTKHTYRHKAQQMSDFAELGMVKQEEPLVSIIIASCRPINVDRMVENVTQQNHPRLEVIYALTPNFSETDQAKLASVDKRSPNIQKVKTFVFSEEMTLGQCLNEAILASSGKYIAKCDDDNFYLENYISDQLIPFSFGDYSVVGKESYFCYLGGLNKLIWRFPENRHKDTAFVAGDAMIIRRDVFNKTAFPEARIGEDTKLLKDIKKLGGKIYSTDHFNFIKYRNADLTQHTWRETEEKLMRRSVVIANGLNLDKVRC